MKKILLLMSFLAIIQFGYAQIRSVKILEDKISYNDDKEASVLFSLENTSSKEVTSIEFLFAWGASYEDFTAPTVRKNVKVSINPKSKNSITVYVPEAKKHLVPIRRISIMWVRFTDGSIESI